MTFNSVRIACNQTSSRELVVGEDEELVARTLRAAKGQGPCCAYLGRERAVAR
jgi:uncharacterized protein YceH (UPF0502 family)